MVRNRLVDQALIELIAKSLELEIFFTQFLYLIFQQITPIFGI